jgi:hypothetical protein
MADFAHVGEARLRRFLAYWLEKAGTRRMPRRADIDPLDFPWALPVVWLCDYEREGGRYRYRVAGEEINAVYGRNIAGCYLEDVIPAWGLERVRERYRNCVETPAIVHTGGRVYMAPERAYVGERLTLPLGGDDGRPAMVIGLTAYSLRASQAQVPFRREQQAITVTALPGAAGDGTDDGPGTRADAG